MRTLIYPGSSTDNVLNIKSKHGKYDKFILYDLLPDRCCHYKQHEKGYKYVRNESYFLSELKNIYGEYIEKEKDLLYFPDNNIYYHINTDANTVDVPEGDIYVKNFVCEYWIDYYMNRRTIINCKSWAPTAVFNGEFEIIHQDCSCDLEY